MRFADAIRDFGVHLSSERNVSSHTQRAYLSDVRQFAGALGEGRNPAAVTAADVRAFLAGMHMAISARIEDERPSPFVVYRAIDVPVGGKPLSISDRSIFDPGLPCPK